MMPKIEIAPDPAASARRVADRVLQQAREAVRARGRFTFVLTGGNSPVNLYRLLAEDEAYRDFPWSQTLCFFGDERHVPPDGVDSNYRLACETLFHTRLVPQENIYRFRAELLDPYEVAAEYEEVLRQQFPEKECLGGFPRFDVLLLGLGYNGHTASLFPGSPGLQERTRWAIANPVPELHNPRLTLTYPALNASRVIYLEATAPDKKKIVSDLVELENRQLSIFPVQGIQPVNGEYFWFLTQENAPDSLR